MTRPLIVPQPVTTPSPGNFVSAMPNSVQRCSTIHVELFERVLIKQQVDTLTRGQLAALVLRFDPPFAATEPRDFAAPFEFNRDVVHGKCPSLALQPAMLITRRG